MTTTAHLSIIDTCMEIIRLTNDGNDLAPGHLALIQAACNRGLTEAGEVALEELHASAVRGYTKPWHFGVEHVTKDHEGYIYWRGKQLEHYSHSDAEKECEDTRALAAACLALEVQGKEINLRNYLNQLHPGIW